MKSCLSIVIVALLLVGCTPTAPGPATSSAPSVSTSAPSTATSADFPVLPGRALGLADAFYTLASRGRMIVGAGWVISGRERLVFRFSEDQGRTWSEGTVDNAPATPRRDWVAQIVARPDGWLAVGSTQDEEGLVWTSSDGRRWQRHEIAPTEFDPQRDDFGELIAVSDGVLLVGRRDRPGRSSVASAWRSTDGLEWNRVSLPGGRWVADAAALGRQLVAIGSTDGDDRVWNSADGGRTWRRSEVRLSARQRPPGRSLSLSAVAVWGSKFLISGEIADRPVLLSTQDGRQWRYANQSASVPSNKRFAQADQLASGGGTRLLAVREGTPTTRQKFAWFGGGRWHASRTPKPGKRSADVYVIDLVLSGSVGVAAVIVDSGREDRTELWRTTDGGRRFVRLVDPWDLAAETPRNQPQVLTPVGDGFLVAGVSRDRMVSWTVDRAGVVGGPRRISDDASTDPTVARSAGDAVLVGGERAVGNPQEAMTWVSTDHGQFAQSKLGTFQPSGAYAASTIRGVRYLATTWWVVGDRSRSGWDDGALVASSRDGKRWRLGRATGRAKTIDDTKVDDLRGNDERSRSMFDLAGSKAGLVAVGAASRRIGEEPAVWRSVDGRSWALDIMTDRRYDGGRITSVASAGLTLVAVGEVRRAGSARPIAWVWRSTDGGRRWTSERLGADADTVAAIVRTDDQFAVYGRNTADDGVRIWRSTDGAAWSAVDLPDAWEDADAAVQIVDAGPDPGGLMTLVRVATREQTTTQLVHVALG